MSDRRSKPEFSFIEGDDFTDKMHQFRQEHPGATLHQSARHMYRLLVEHGLMQGRGDAGLECLWHSVCFDSDRGAVLVTASILDGMAESKIRAFMSSASDVDGEDLAWWFHGARAPLANTAIKFRLCHAMGIIDRELRDALLHVDAIGSSVAAHSRGPFTVTEKLVVELARKIPRGMRQILVGKQDAPSPSALAFGELAASLGLYAGKLGFALCAVSLVAGFQACQAEASQLLGSSRTTQLAETSRAVPHAARVQGRQVK